MESLSKMRDGAMVQPRRIHLTISPLKIPMGSPKRKLISHPPMYSRRGSVAKVSGLILAGGKGERFGGHKALAKFAGEPIILRPVRVLRHLTSEIVIAHGRGENRALLEGIEKEAIMVADEEMGPLGGLLSGSRAASGEWILVAPCDAPLVSKELYAELLSSARGLEGSVPRLEGHDNPTIAAYRRSAVVRACQGTLGEGITAARNILPRLRLSYLEREALDRMPYGLQCVFDVDTPDDLRRAEEILLREG